LPFCHFVVHSLRPGCGDIPKCLSSLGDHLRARRINLGLFQSQVAARIGVHELTVCNWEGNESQPAVKYIPAIIRFLGYHPQVPTTSFPERLIAARRARGLTQKELAAEMGIDASTVQHWERGEHKPSVKKMAMLSSLLL
jgi:transcriptional regulator with XRE-family HTH domain